MILYSYDPWLVAVSIVVSMMASFTGLSLTRGISGLVESQRQLRIIMASVALGGGIWSMHFVAMLAMRFPVPVFYDLLQTTASALIAILLAGLALILMHFGTRGPWRTVAAGMILGFGIVTMHYVGIEAIDGCRPMYRPAGFAVAGALAGGMGVLAMAIAYGRRTARNTVLATLVFGASVVVVHFSAMYWTDFIVAARRSLDAPSMANSEIALVVLFAGFMISGAFLLTSASFLNSPVRDAVRQAGESDAQGIAAQPGMPPATAAATSGQGLPGGGTPDLSPDPSADSAQHAAPGLAERARAVSAAAAHAPRIPYERDGATYFLRAAEVAALRAEGHYTILYSREGRLFCPWSISLAEERLAGRFVRVHRSYLVNITHVTGFERHKDTGMCHFNGVAGLERVPVARSRLSEVRAALGL